VAETVGPEFGSLDVLANAADRTGQGSVEEMAAADWRALVEINLTGASLVSQAASPALCSARGGNIGNCSSVNAHTGANELSAAAYAAGMAGLEALTRHLAIHLAPAVLVNSVALGPVATGMLGRLSGISARPRRTDVERLVK
jgi:NAD(P)-dependent dehydrogenase (short-subunit alcohol dehydrogenase family)